MKIKIKLSKNSVDWRSLLQAIAMIKVLALPLPPCYLEKEVLSIRHKQSDINQQADYSEIESNNRSINNRDE